MDDNQKIELELKNTQLAYQMAALLSQFKSGFLARTAHELRSPLTKLISLQQLILFDLCDNRAEQQEFLDEAHQLAQKILKNLDKIINISKIDYCRNKLNLELIQLSQVFSDVYSSTYLQAAHKNLQLEIIIPEPNIYVEVDPNWFRQMLVILIDTAISCSESGRIKMFAESELNDLVVNLDLPCSITIISEPIDLLQQIPEPTSEQINSFSQYLELSPGMKLSLAQTLLEAMGGKLTIESLTSPLPEPSLTRLQCRIPLSSEQVNP